MAVQKKPDDQLLAKNEGVIMAVIVIDYFDDQTAKVYNIANQIIFFVCPYEMEVWTCDGCSAICLKTSSFGDENDFQRKLGLN